MGRYLPASKEAAAAAAGACAERGVAQVVGLINTLGATFQLSPAATGAAEDDAPSTPRPRAEAEGGAHAASPPAVLFRKVLADGEDPTAPGAADWLGGSTIAQEVGPARHRCAPRRAALALAERACTHTHTHTHTLARARAQEAEQRALLRGLSGKFVTPVRAHAAPSSPRPPLPKPKPKPKTQTQTPAREAHARPGGLGSSVSRAGGWADQRWALAPAAATAEGWWGAVRRGRAARRAPRGLRPMSLAAGAIAEAPRRQERLWGSLDGSRKGGGGGAQRVNTAIPLFTLFTCSLTLSPAFLSSLALSPSPQPSLTFALTLLRSGLRAPRIGHGCARAPRTLHPVPASRLAQLAG